MKIHPSLPSWLTFTFALIAMLPQIVSAQTTVNGGASLSINGDAALGPVPLVPTVNLTLDNGGVKNNNSTNVLNINRIVQLNAAGGWFTTGWTQNTTIHGQITGPGNLTINNDSGWVILTNPANDYSGGTTVGGNLNGWNGGVARLRLGASDVIPNGTVTINNGGAIDLNGFNETVSALTATGTGTNGAITNGGGAATLTGGISINNTMTVGGTGAIEIDGPIGGSGLGLLTKANANTLTLSGSTDNADIQLTLTGGTVELNKISSPTVHALGGGTHTVNTGTTLRLSGSGGDQIFDASTVTINSGGILDLNGRSETVNTINITGTGSGGNGAIINSAGAAANLGGAITNNNFSVGGTGDVELSGSITGNTLTKVAGNTVTLSGTSNNTTAAVVSAGTLVLGKTSSGSVRAVSTATVNNLAVLQLAGTGGDQIPATATVTVNAGGFFDLNGRNEGVNGLAGTGTILNNLAATTGILTVGESNFGGTFSGVIADGAGAVGFEKTGTGEVILANGGNTYSGGTTVSGGLLRASDQTIGAGDLTLTGGATFFNVSNVAGGVTAPDNNFGRQVTVGAGGGRFRAGWGDMTISGQIVGSGSFTVVNDGAITFSNTGNSYLGDTIIGAGGSGNNATLRLGASGAIPNGAGAGNVVFANIAGTRRFSLFGFDETINGLVSIGGATQIVENGAGTNARLTLGDNNATATYSGNVVNGSSGTLALVKIGTGTQTLSGGTGVDFSGGIDVQAGALIIQNSTGLGNGGDTQQTWNVDSGALLELDHAGGYNLGTSNGTGLMLTGAGTFRKTGAGLLGLDNQGNNNFRITISQASGGLFDIQNGTVRNGGWQGQNWTGNLGDLNIAAGATFDLWDGSNVYVDALTGGGAIVRGIGNGARDFHVGVNGGSGDFSGTISPTNGGNIWYLRKDGAGTQTLSGTGDNAGLQATVNGGVLELAKDSTAGVHALGGGTHTVNSGGTLRLAGTGGDQIVGGSTLTVNSGGVFDLNGRDEVVTTMNIAGTGLGNGAITNSNGTASVLSGTVNNNTFSVGGVGNIEINGAISNNTLTKVNGNTVTLTGTTDNSSGRVQVDGGTLVLAKDSTGGVHAAALIATVNANGVLQLAGTGGDQIYNPSVLTVNSGGVFDLNGRSETVDTMNFAGAGDGNGAITNSNAAASVLSGTVTNNNFSIGGTGNIQLNGAVNGNTLTKVDGNTVTLAGTTDNNSGRVQVDAGTLVLAKTSSGSVHAAALVATVNGGTLQLGGTGGDQIYNPTVLTVNSGGTFDLNGRSETVNTMAVAGTGAGNGAITNSAAGAAVLTGTITNNGFSVGGIGEVQLPGVVSGGGALTKVDSNELILINGSNSYAGGTTVTGGVLRASEATIGSGNLTLDNSGRFFNVSAAYGGSPTPDNNFQRQNTVGAGGGQIQSGWADMTVSGPIVGSGALTVVNDWAITISNLGNSYAGGTIVNSGGLVLISGDGALGAVPGAPTVNLTLNNSGVKNSDSVNVLAANRTISLGAGGGWFTSGWGKNTTINGQITGIGGLTVNNDSGWVIPANPANDYAGNTVVGAGLRGASGGVANLRLGASEVIPHGAGKGDVTINGGGTLDLNGFNETINGLSGSGTISSSSGTPTLTVGADDDTTTFSGSLSNGLALTKIGAGTQTLSGTNTNTGSTTVNGGTLAVSNGAAIADSGAVIVNAGTFRLNSSETVGSLAGIGGTVNVQGNTLTTGGNGATTTVAGALIGTGGLAKAGGGTMTLDNAIGFSGRYQVDAGTLEVANGNMGMPSAIHIAGGATFDTLASQFDPGAAVTVSGTGNLDTSGAGVAWNSNVTFEPGNSPGQLNIVGNVDWSTAVVPGGTYNWEVYDANGGAGNALGYDLINITGSLDMTSGSGTINGIGLSGIGPDIAGLPLNVDMEPGAQTLFEIIRTSTGVIGFGSFSPTFVNSMNHRGFFKLLLGNGGNSVYLLWEATPEPGTWVLLGVLLIAGGTVARRRRRQAARQPEACSA